MSEIRVVETMIKGRYNLVDLEKDGEEKYIQQLSKQDVKALVLSCLELIKE